MPVLIPSQGPNKPARLKFNVANPQGPVLPPQIDKDLELEDQGLKTSYANWLNNQPANIDNIGVEQSKKYLRLFLKDAKPEVTTKIKNMLLQHNLINNLLSFIYDVSKKEDLENFIRLLPHNKLADFWQTEAGLIQQSQSLRKAQKKRLIIIYKNMALDQLEKSMVSDKFWILLQDLPVAAARGLTVEHFRSLAAYFMTSQTAVNHDREKIIERSVGFAKEVMSKIDIDKVKPDDAYEIFLAMAPVAKFNKLMEDIINRKLAVLARKPLTKNIQIIKNAMK